MSTCWALRRAATAIAKGAALIELKKLFMKQRDFQAWD